MKNRIKPFLNVCFICGQKNKKIRSKLWEEDQYRCPNRCFVFYICNNYPYHDGPSISIDICHLKFLKARNYRINMFKIKNGILTEESVGKSHYYFYEDLFVGSNYECLVYLEKYVKKYIDNLEFI